MSKFNTLIDSLIDCEFRMSIGRTNKNYELYRTNTKLWRTNDSKRIY